MSEIKEVNGTVTLPIVPLRGMVAFPAIQLNIEIVRPASLKAFTAGATLHDAKVILLTQKDVSCEEPKADDFYKMGAVDGPIVSINHITPFLENKVDPLFGYYCCGQTHKVSNRFFCMPQSRNRAIATMFFKFNLKGFLTWGYNFYFSKGSEHLINPFLITDAVGSFPSGDSFSVYPGRNGPIESIRLFVFTQALYDLRVMRLLESLIGHDEVVKIIEEVAEQEITFDEYPHTDDFTLILRERINQEIEKRV